MPASNHRWTMEHPNTCSMVSVHAMKLFNFQDDLRHRKCNRWHCVEKLELRNLLLSADEHDMRPIKLVSGHIAFNACTHLDGEGKTFAHAAIRLLATIINCIMQIGSCGCSVVATIAGNISRLVARNHVVNFCMTAARISNSLCVDRLHCVPYAFSKLRRKHFIYVQNIETN